MCTPASSRKNPARRNVQDTGTESLQADCSQALRPQCSVAANCQNFLWPSASTIPIFFFPSCASVALARSSHIVVLMNELHGCIYCIPLWGVESGAQTITQSEVLSVQTKNQNRKQPNQTTTANKKQTPKTKQRKH